MPSAPAVTEAQVRVLQLARDAGHVRPEELESPISLYACYRKRWLAPRTGGFVLTDGGRAALAYFYATEKMAKLWSGTPTAQEIRVMRERAARLPRSAVRSAVSATRSDLPAGPR